MIFASSLLLQDVRAPAGRPGAGEERGEQIGRYAREVQHDRRPELDVGLQDPVRLALAQLGQGGVLQRQRHLVARRGQLLRRRAQDPRPRVLGPVDRVPEAHQPLSTVQNLTHVRPGVAAALHRLDHAERPGRGATVQRAGHRGDRGGQAGRDIGAGAGHHPGGEGGRVHAVLGGADPVPVDRLGPARIGLALPADQETLGRAAALVDPALRHRRLVGAARGLGHEREHHRRGAGQIRPGLGGVDVDQRPQTPVRGQHRGGRLHVDPGVAGVHRQRERLGGGHARG